MSENITDEEIYEAKKYVSIDQAESSRKRMRLDNNIKKSWSLTDSSTDQEVLQEMGVGLLEPDDADLQYESTISSHMHRAQKRKLDIENVNPNVNSSSPRSKLSPRSPKNKIYSPSAGPSKAKSPRRSEKSKPVHSMESKLETTLIGEYQIDEETPLAQSVSGQYMRSQTKVYSVENSSGKKVNRNSCITLDIEEEIINQRLSKSEPQGSDSFSTLSDEMILSVFKWLPKRTLAHCMMVCKRWHRVASDETLWQRLDLGNKVISKNALGRILSRKPVIVRLASSEIAEWTPTNEEPSRIQYLDLSMCTLQIETLSYLLERCPALKKLSVEGVQLNDLVCSHIGKCSNLETLNLTMATGISAEGLTYILDGCSSLQSLNISWCTLSEAALEVLVSKTPPRLQRLNIGGARIMTDSMVSKLVSRCPRLLELDLSDCSRLTAESVHSLLSLSRLQHLALSRCYLLPAHVLTKLSSMSGLQYLEVWGMLQTTSLNALKAALPAIQINQFMFSAIARPTVGTRRTSIWGLRTRD